LAQAVGVLKLGNISLDGSKIHADSSKSHAVSYKRLIEIEAQLKAEVNELSYQWPLVGISKAAFGRIER
jgi:hypothetical protein